MATPPAVFRLSSLALALASASLRSLSLRVRPLSPFSSSFAMIICCRDVITLQSSSELIQQQNLIYYYVVVVCTRVQVKLGSTAEKTITFVYSPSEIQRDNKLVCSVPVLVLVLFLSR